MIRFSQIFTLALSLGLGLAPLGAAARERGHDRDDHRIFVQTRPGCPPGLAKKHNGCTPPGHAKQDRWERGERITGDYVVITEPGLYRLDPRHSYWRSGDYVYRVDRQTGKVLDLIGAVSALLN